VLTFVDTSFQSTASSPHHRRNRTGFTFTESTAHRRGILASRLRNQLLIRIQIYDISYLSPFHTGFLSTSAAFLSTTSFIICPSPSNTTASCLRHQLLVFVENLLQHQPSSPSDTTFCLGGIPASSLRRILASYLQYQLHISVF
jgi:hypothetical protein